MLFTSEMIKEEDKKKIPPIPLHVIIETIGNFLELALDLYLKHPEIKTCIEIFKENCVSPVYSEEINLKYSGIMDTLYLNSDRKELCYRDLYKNHFKIAQIAVGDLAGLKLNSINFFPTTEQKIAAKNILLSFLDVTLEKIQELDNEKNCSVSIATTARLSESSQERDSFESRSILFQKSVGKDKESQSAKCECF